jgi:magnesium-transporting ATPase (P-type)
MILTDDNFATIQAAVEEGRGVFDNLRKFIVWTLPTNVGEGCIILVAILLGITLPVSPCNCSGSTCPPPSSSVSCSSLNPTKTTS